MARRVLLADASPTIHTLVRLLLAADAVDLVIATSGQAALDSARSQPPQLVLADVLLPGLGGAELTRALRSEPSTARVPVLLLSPPHLRTPAEEAREAGARGVLAKPFDRETFLAAVRRELPPAEAPRPAVGPVVETPASGGVSAAELEARVAAIVERTVARVLDERLQPAIAAAVQRMVGAEAERIIREELDRLVADEPA
jgi:CheY-like chemotaxis protein